MALSDDDISWLVAQGLMGEVQAHAVRSALQSRPAPPPPPATPAPTASPAPAWRAHFDLLHVAYYFGALLVIGAMGFFMNVGWEAFGNGGIATIALAYATVFVLVGHRLWKQGLVVPGGLLITMAVSMVPLATYGVEKAIGWWPATDPGTFGDFHIWVRSGWLLMEATTIVAAAAALRWFRFPFLTAPLAFCLWYVSMDATPLIAGDDFIWQARGWVSLGFGLATVAVGGIVEKRSHRDFGFWLYLFGQLAFWGGLTTVAFGSDEYGVWSPVLRALTGLLGLGAVGLGFRFNRHIFTLFGAYAVLTLAGYLGSRTSTIGSLGAMAYGASIIALVFLGDGPEVTGKAGFGYLVGAATLFAGLTPLTFLHDSEWRKALFVPACLLAMVTGVVLQRRVFMIFSSIGIFSYLTYLATEIFKDSLLFPFVISGIGLAIIALAVALRRHQQRWRQALLEQLPSWLVDRLPVGSGNAAQPG